MDAELPLSLRTERLSKPGPRALHDGCSSGAGVRNDGEELLGYSREGALGSRAIRARVIDQLLGQPVLVRAFVAGLVVDERRDGHPGPREVPEVGVEAEDVAAVAPDLFAGELFVGEAEPVLGWLEDRLDPVGHLPP
jgi:hypothetical protein